MKNVFYRASRAMVNVAGHPAAFFIATIFIVAWAVSGPIFGFSDTWQLVINTSTTIITFLLVFLIQTSQNRDTEAIHLKLDELISTSNATRDDLIHIEAKDEDKIKEIKRRLYDE